MEKPVKHARNIGIQKTELPPCSIAVHPSENVIFFGTYLLEENRSRSGSIDVYDSDLSLITSTKSDSSILDLKLYPSDPSVIMTAMSTGSVVVWKWSGSDQSVSILQEYQLFGKDVLVLSLVFNEQDPTMISVTLTTGEVSVLKYGDSGLSVVDTFESHGLECWISNFIPDMGLLLSGGDDQKLVGHDLRSATKVWETQRLHDAGITSILPRESSVKLWTGGYDDQLKESDLRMIQIVPPKQLKEMNLGGGVWRLLPAADRRGGGDNSILACCMYGGARILRPDESGEEPAIVAETITDNHNSMVYGGAWGDDWLVTCSFYDKIVQKWQV